MAGLSACHFHWIFSLVYFRHMKETPKILASEDIKTMRKDLKNLKGFKTPTATVAQKPAMPPPVKVQPTPPSPPLKPQPAPAPAQPTPQPVVAQKVSLPINPPPSLKIALDKKEQNMPIQNPPQMKAQPQPQQPRPKTFMEEVEEVAQHNNT